MLRSRRIVPDIPRALRRPRSRPARPDRLQPHRRIARPLQAGAERVPMPPVPAGNDFERLLAPVRDWDSAAGPACAGADRPLDRSVGLAPGLAAAMCARRGSLTAPLRARAARSRRPRSSPGRPPSRSGSAPDPRGRDPGGLHRARGCAPAAGRSPRLAPPCRSGVTGPGALPSSSRPGPRRGGRVRINGFVSGLVHRIHVPQGYTSGAPVATHVRMTTVQGHGRSRTGVGKRSGGWRRGPGRGGRPPGQDRIGTDVPISVQLRKHNGPPG